jgi:hypothetical protein
MNKSLNVPRISFLLSFFIFFCLQNAFTQNFFGKTYQHVHDERCAALHIEKMQEERLGIYGSREYFESWIEKQIASARKKPQDQLRVQNEPIQIPVVVHVIHTGTPVGQSANIPNAQILSQIRILTEDFRRTNPDANQTPEEFQSVAADANIEFILAKQDPRGLPTDGINRVQGPKNVYTPSDAELIGQLALWDPEDYLNIWVVPLVSPFIGYASFPISNLPGLNIPPNTKETDGVTIDYRYFGTGGNSVSGSRGRTLTHEVGHFLGLRHIWGDGDCSVDDFVADTPIQDGSNTVCRTSTPRFTCNTRDMVENFMDYTPDNCMNLFTAGQVERMQVVLSSSPRRASLVNGRATRDPQLLENDLGISNILDPQAFICSPTITPQVRVFNAGNNRITTASIEIRLNGAVVQTRNVTLNLTTGQEADVNFNPITIAGDNNRFTANILTVNNTSDPNPGNNVISSSPKLTANLTIPYTLTPAAFNQTWKIDNPDGKFTWEQLQLNIGGVNQNVIRIQHYEYEGIGQLDYLISPQFNLSQFPNAQLTFLMAYSPYNAQGFEDELIVALSTDCGNTFNIINAPYNKGKDFLQTVNPSIEEFIPNSETQFRREVVNLAPYAELGNVRIAFITRNGWGNNIYLKNIELLSEERYVYDMRLNELVKPSPISNGLQNQLEVSITNTGNLPVNGFVFRRAATGSIPQTFLARGNKLEPGETTLITIPNTPSQPLNRFEFTLLNPNFDQNLRNTINLIRYTLVNTEVIQTPWRQTFNNTTVLSPWTTINTENNFESWIIAPLQSGPANNNIAKLETTERNNSFWLGSPIFALTRSSQASVFFNKGAGRVSPTTVLKIMVSENGGQTYKEVRRMTGPEITTVQSPDINPNEPASFVREFVNLSEFAGTGKTNVRMAFVVENGQPDNSPIYIDNVELFLSANPEPVDPGLGRTIIYPNPARDVFNIVFNFNTFENVNIQIISPTGATVHNVNYPNTLNQTYSFSSALFSRGLFIVRITSNSITEIRKLYIY